jgi:hypothetical protein
MIDGYLRLVPSPLKDGHIQVIDLDSGYFPMGRKLCNFLAINMNSDLAGIPSSKRFSVLLGLFILICSFAGFLMV